MANSIRVELLKSHSMTDLQNKIHEFTFNEPIKIHDIKYTIVHQPDYDPEEDYTLPIGGYIGDDVRSEKMLYSVLIIYEDHYDFDDED